MKHFLFACFFLIVTSHVYSQDVYKTPSGKRYHLSTCRMVKNVSSKVALETIQDSKLTPCKICKPPTPNKLQKRFTSDNKAVGTSGSVRCKGYTKKGTRCKHKTKLANGFCFQHTKQAENPTSQSVDTQRTNTSARCLGKTKSGKRCKRTVKNGRYCYQHG